MQDKDLEQNIEVLKFAIQTWAQQHDLWHEASFQSWFERCDDEPQENPCVLVFCPGSQLGEMLHGYYGSQFYEEFTELVYKFGYEFELDGFGALLFYVRYDKKKLIESYRDYFEWKWICSLVQLEFSDLYEEVYERFSKRPHDLYSLEPRQLEIFLDGVFRNNGYRTQLGSGQGDGGADIRLYSNDVINEVVTLVQVKRYASKAPIRLEAVQALTAVVEDEKANRGLFITTSRYLPGVKRFASRQNSRIILATSDDVAKWSGDAAKKIVEYKSHLLDKNYLEYLLRNGESSNSLEGKILHANTGYSMTMNSFAIVLRESRTAALLLRLPLIKDDNTSGTGFEYPCTQVSIINNFIKFYEDGYVFRAKKKYKSGGDLYFWGNQSLYSIWDKQKKYYDYFD